MLRKIMLSLVIALIATEFSKAQAPASSAAKGAPIFELTTEVSKQIDRALAKSRKENRRVSIHWGSNESEPCNAFHQSLVGDRDIGKTLRYEYDVVCVEVDGSIQNQEQLKRYGVKLAKGSASILWPRD